MRYHRWYYDPYYRESVCILSLSKPEHHTLSSPCQLSSHSKGDSSPRCGWWRAVLYQKRCSDSIISWDGYLGLPFALHTGHPKCPGKSVLNMSPHNPIQTSYSHIGVVPLAELHKHRSSCLFGLIVQTIHPGLSQAQLREPPYSYLSAQISLLFFLESSDLFTRV